MKKFGWLLIGYALLTIVFGTMYTLLQQSNRQVANDAPTIVAEQVRDQLNIGKQPADLAVATVDIAKSSAPFSIIYDKKGLPVAGTGRLHNALPKIPIGVLQNATPEKSNTVTWEPESKVRIASVAVVADDYYVLGGQSLSFVEARTTTLLVLTFLGWLASILLLTGGQILFGLKSKKAV